MVAKTRPKSRNTQVSTPPNLQHLNGFESPSNVSQMSTPSPNLQCLNGPRALSSLHVLLFHVYMIFLPLETEEVAIAKAEKSTLRTVLINGTIAVDVFKVLTGCLAAFTLFPKFHVSTTKHTTTPMKNLIWTYYQRRVFKLFPIYLTGLAFSCVLAWHAVTYNVAGGAAALYNAWFTGCPSQLWTNFLFINNQFPPFGCALTYWTLAVTFQFYFLFPLCLALLRPSRPGFTSRVAALLLLLLSVSTGYRIWSAHSAVPQPFPVALTIADPARAMRLRSWLYYVYFPSTGRITALVVGVALGMVLCTPATLQKFRERRRAVSVLAVAAEIGLWWTCQQQWHSLEEDSWSRLQSTVFGAILHNGSILPAAACALFFLAMIIEADPAHAALARLFSTPVFSKLSQLSLGIFIFHPLALYVCMLWLDTMTWWKTLMENKHTDAGLAVACVGTVIVSYAAAAVYEKCSTAVSACFITSSSSMVTRRNKKNN